MTYCDHVQEGPCGYCDVDDSLFDADDTEGRVIDQLERGLAREKAAREDAEAVMLHGKDLCLELTKERDAARDLARQLAEAIRDMKNHPEWKTPWWCEDALAAYDASVKE